MSLGILVTGGAGFIGHHLVRTLLRNSKYAVTIIDDMSNANPNFRPEEFSGIAFYKEDIRNKEIIADIIRRENIRTCVHLAAKISVADSIADPLASIDVNVNGILSVLAACAEIGVGRFVFASSAAVYGESRILPIPEGQDLSPISPYGSTKVAGEELVNLFSNSGKIPNATILRFFNVYGIGQSPEYAGVITRFAERLSNRLPPIIYGSGRQTRDFISVDDVVRSIILAIEKEASGIYNIGTGTPTSIKDLAKQMIANSGLDLTPVYEKAIKGDIVHSYAAISKAKKFLHFSPSADLYQTLQMMFGLKATETVTN